MKYSLLVLFVMGSLGAQAQESGVTTTPQKIETFSDKLTPTQLQDVQLTKPEVPTNITEAGSTAPGHGCAECAAAVASGIALGGPPKATQLSPPTPGTPTPDTGGVH